MKPNNFKKYSIIVIVYSFILQYLNIGLVVDGMNVLYPALEQAHGWTRGAIGAATSAAVYIAIVAGVIIATLIMKFGIRKIMLPAIVLLGIDVIFMANTTSFNGFAFSMVMVQVLSIALMIGSMALCTNWFKKGRGRVLGIVTIGAPLSSATFVMVGTKVVMANGYPFFYSGVGALVVAVGIIGAFIIKNKPEDIGLLPDGEEMADGHNHEVEKATSGKSIWLFKEMIANKEMWLISIGFGLIFLMMTGIMSTAIPRLTDVGIPIDQALWFFTLAAILGMPFSYFWGWLDDKISTPKTCAIFACVYIFGSVCFLFGSVENMVMAFGGVLCIALTTGGMPNLQPSIQAWVYGRKEFVATSRYTGVIHNIFRGSAFAYMGMMFTRFGTYNQAYISFIFMAIISAICFVFIRKSYESENKEAKNID